MFSQCLHGGQFILSHTLNASYCQCDPCHQGVHCEDPTPHKVQMQFDTEYVRLSVYLIELCLSLSNNLLSLAVFQGSKRIRRTSIGVYLTIYSIVAIVGNVLLVVGQFVQYLKPYPFVNNEELSETFHCFLDKSGYQITALLCLSLSALVAFERGLIIRRKFRMNATRWRSVITLLPIFCIIATISVPWLIYRCKWNIPHQASMRRILSGWFYTVDFLAGLIYVLATLLVLISFALRIHHYGTTQESKTKIFFELLKTHLFVFIPPIIYLLCVIPYLIWFPLKGPTQPYFQCGISTVEYIFKVIVQTLPNLPTVITWLIFIYPSNVYMTEFYTETWIGWIWMRRVAMTNFEVPQRSSQSTAQSDLEVFIKN
jgi:hypothetical protein